MFCSNCGAQLPPNGVCAQCGVKATNMTFDGYTQGQPVVPQQSFYNPNTMYVQYQAPQQAYGQPYIPQQNVAIGGIKDPSLVAGIGATIKNGCGSMMMVFASLFVTLAMIFSFIQMIYATSSAGYGVEDEAIFVSMILFFLYSVPLILFTIGMWVVTFQGFGTYRKKFFNDKACMGTSGFSTIQSGGIVALVAIVPIGLFLIFGLFVVMIFGVGAGTGFGADTTEFTLDVFLLMMILTVIFVLMIIMYSSIISQMSKIKHAIRGRNYESISVLLPVLLFIMALVHCISLVYSAIYEDVLGIITSAVYLLSFSFVGCTLLYLRSKVNGYINDCYSVR